MLEELDSKVGLLRVELHLEGMKIGERQGKKARRMKWRLDLICLLMVVEMLNWPEEVAAMMEMTCLFCCRDIIS